MGNVDPPFSGRFRKTVVTDVHLPGLAENCWAWEGSHDRAGHARVKADGKNRHVRRLVLECDGEPLPRADEVIALCSNPWCVNRTHLLRATASERRAFRPRSRLGLGDVWIAKRLIAERETTPEALARNWEISPRLLRDAVDRIQ